MKSLLEILDREDYDFIANDYIKKFNDIEDLVKKYYNYSSGEWNRERLANDIKRTYLDKEISKFSMSYIFFFMNEKISRYSLSVNKDEKVNLIKKDLV